MVPVWGWGWGGTRKPMRGDEEDSLTSSTPSSHSQCSSSSDSWSSHMFYMKGEALVGGRCKHRCPRLLLLNCNRGAVLASLPT